MGGVWGSHHTSLTEFSLNILVVTFKTWTNQYNINKQLKS